MQMEGYRLFEKDRSRRRGESGISLCIRNGTGVWVSFVESVIEGLKSCGSSLEE